MKNYKKIMTRLLSKQIAFHKFLCYNPHKAYFLHAKQNLCMPEGNPRHMTIL